MDERSVEMEACVVIPIKSSWDRSYVIKAAAILRESQAAASARVAAILIRSYYVRKHSFKRTVAMSLKHV